MGRMLLPFLVPLAVLPLGGWWRRLEARLWPANETPAPAPGQAPLSLVVRNVLWRLDGRAARQFARLEAAVAEDLAVGADRQALEELLLVLCSHAIETTPCGVVLVTGRRRGEEVVLSILDDGIGIETARTAGVMERARELLAVLGGRLEIKRHRGAGTTMTILLPARAAPWNATIQNAMADFARVAATPHGAPGKAVSPVQPS